MFIPIWIIIETRFSKLLDDYIWLLQKSVDKKILIHAIPHTHLDAGWLETFENYYVNNVSPILDSLIPTLEDNPEYRFNWAEVGFLQRWWSVQNKATQKRFQKLVQDGKIQFVGGGWVQHDEALVSYSDAIVQLEAGWAFLWDKFGIKPHVAWQLDPFGYSAITPTLFSEYGFDTLFMTRVGTYVKQDLRDKGHLQFIWEGQRPDQKLFVHVNQGELYTVTPKIHYDQRIIGETCHLKDIEEENLECLDFFVQDIVENFMNTTDLHSSNEDKIFHIPALFGDDFAYQKAQDTFYYIDQLSKLLSKFSLEKFGIQMDIRYSTVDEYLQAIHSDTKTYPVYQGDFFPYMQVLNCDDIECLEGKRMDYWSGYYSTKPGLKQEIKDLLQMQRNSEKLFAFSQFVQYLASQEVDQKPIIEIMNRTREAASILLHHDAITGTQTQHVKKDYEQRISNTKMLIDANNQELLGQVDQILKKYQLNNDKLHQFLNEQYQNRDQYAIKSIQHMRIFNPMMDAKLQHIVEFTHNITEYLVVLDGNMDPQVIQTQRIHQWDSRKTEVQTNQTTMNVKMLIDQFYPFSIHSFLVILMSKINKHISTCELVMNSRQIDKLETNLVLENEQLQLTINKDGMLEQIQNKDVVTKLTQQYLHYDGKDTHSGLYVFSPKSQAKPVVNIKLDKIHLQDGNLQVCADIFHKSDRMGDILFHNQLCLDKVGQQQGILRQKISSYTSNYNELVIRTKVDTVNSKDIKEVKFFTDNSLDLIRRHSFTLDQALDNGLAFEMDKIPQIGYNNYPCTSGLVIESNEYLHGQAFSHPVACHLIDDQTYELILIRSLGNNDVKGTPSLRNLDVSISQIQINHAMALSTNTKDQFVQSYNQAKQLAEIGYSVFTSTIDDNWKGKVLLDYQIFKKTLVNNSKIDFQRAYFDDTSDKLFIYIRSTQSSPVKISTLVFSPLQVSKVKLSQILKNKKDKKFDYQQNEQMILSDIKAPYEVFNKAQDVSDLICEQDEICLQPYELAAIQLQMVYKDPQQESSEQEQRRLQNTQSQTGSDNQRKRRKFSKRDLPLEGDTSIHQCFKLYQFTLLVLGLMASSLFCFYAKCAQNKKILQMRRKLNKPKKGLTNKNS
eukprot:403361757